MFQAEMGVLLRELKQRGAPDPEDQDIATQLCRVSAEQLGDIGLSSSPPPPPPPSSSSSSSSAAALPHSCAG
jgi:hypothetical protein